MTDRALPAEQRAEWDGRYSGSEQMWSGLPNGVLVEEVGDRAAGRALDVGCGEGADAVWLARRGWEVTGLDVSAVALERARVHADDAGVDISWVVAGLVEAQMQPRYFDLVSVQYPALLRTVGRDAERALLAAVAPGGTLLVVHHQHADGGEEARRHGFDPDLYVGSDDIADLLDEDWSIQTQETRPRHLVTGAGAGHTHDLVLKAERRR